jgi:hypothetical protein
MDDIRKYGRPIDDFADIVAHQARPRVVTSVATVNPTTTATTYLSLTVGGSASAQIFAEYSVRCYKTGAVVIPVGQYLQAQIWIGGMAIAESIGWWQLSAAQMKFNLVGFSAPITIPGNGKTTVEVKLTHVGKTVETYGVESGILRVTSWPVGDRY